MTMFTLVKNFVNDEDGAVTVDWVVLTAAIVGLGLAVMAAVTNGLSNVSGKIETELTGTTIITEFGTAGGGTDG